MLFDSEVLVVIVALSINWVKCTIDGLSYTDPLKYGLHASTPRSYNPCNPLYWFPAKIPDYCYEPTTLTPYINNAQSQSKWLKIPIPQPIAVPMIPQFPLPYGIPLAPTNPMIPVAGVPHPSLHGQYGMLPGLPGLVSPDGGINVLPFSDVYADVLEKHKQKMIRRRLQKVLDEYDDYPRRRYYKRRTNRY